MAKVFEQINDELKDFVSAQQMFFVATAPLAADGHINLSPKGLDTFRLLDEHTALYLDLTGSGIETIAHLKENGRIVLMFCAFNGPARIVRFHGSGTVYEKGSAEFDEHTQRFGDFPSARAVIRINIHRVADSCGYGVPLYEFKGQRETLPKYTAHLSETELHGIRRQYNAQSLDGLTGLKFED
jgi:hypothetical protein